MGDRMGRRRIDLIYPLSGGSAAQWKQERSSELLFHAYAMLRKVGLSSPAELYLVIYGGRIQ